MKELELLILEKKKLWGRMKAMVCILRNEMGFEELVS